MLQTGIPWEDLPQALGLGSGMTCWRRLRDWQAAGVWKKLHLAVLARLREHDQTSWEQASIDGASVLSLGRPGDRTLPDRPGKARQQTPYRRRCARHPLAVTVAGSNRYNFIAFEAPINAIAPLPGHFQA
ncbi:MAG: hypothetical protein NVSMB34_07670 [Variovorax sp.]